MNQKLIAGALLLSVGLCGCGGGGGGGGGDIYTGGTPQPGCGTAVAPGVYAIITDAANGAPAVTGSTAVITDGTFTETLRPNNVITGTDGVSTYYSAEGAVGRAGTYTLEVTRPGYQTFRRENILVTSNECGVQTQVIQVALQRSAQ